ncbi:DNA replication/repair protein RecF [Thermaurantiacus sp.]
MTSPAIVTSLGLGDFRNHRLTRIEVGGARLVLLLGANGAGKTNILEALSLLSPGRGLRGARLSEMARAGGAGGFTVAATIVPDPDLPPVELRTGAEAMAPDRRRLLVNGAPAALAALSDWLPLLWVTPAMDRLFAEPAAARRRFLDRLALALHPDHARHASRYEAAMRARARILGGEGRPDPAWLQALELQMAEHGAALAEARRSTVAALGTALMARADPAFPAPLLSLAGDVEGADWPARLLAARPADRASGRTTDAPHRVDLVAVHAATGLPAAQASTGEQKAMLLAILLAHAGLVGEASGRLPLLLLDEAAAHLDAGRRRALLDRLAALGGQAWLSGTDEGLFDGHGGRAFHLADGVVTPLAG